MVIVNATGSANFINLNYKEASALPYPATNIIQIELIHKKKNHTNNFNSIF